VRYSRRRKLGQHFLTDTRYRRRILERLRLRPDDLAVEIGAGRGAMTGLLAERCGRVVAIEVDPALAQQLQQAFQAEPRVEILQADILATDLSAVCRRHRSKWCFVFGNLPYYITSPIVHHLFAYRAWIRAMSLLVQREVAERLTAAPGTRAYGFLSVLAQAHSRPRVALGVPPGAFSPPPQVHSALVDFQMSPKFPEWSEKELTNFLDFAKRCFAQKRKMLVNNLAGIYLRARLESELAALALPPSVRAEQLTVEQLAGLFRRLT
jgi:16S rRNA (adenine1518-N6/adenine1519-N6)-dimethyltransferase